MRVLSTGGPLLILLAAPVVSAEYYVDASAATAADDNPGTEAQPWLTIGKAAASLQPGDTALVRPGVYREGVVVRVSGEEGRPITFRALREKPDDRVIVSGADVIEGWQPCTAELAGDNPNHRSMYCAEIDWAPSRLIEDGRCLLQAREPNEGWWVAEGGGTHTVQDSTNLLWEQDVLAGASIFFWDVDTTSHNSRRITSLDPATHTLTLETEIYRDRVVEAGADRYFLTNSVRLIDRPGEWAVDTNIEPHRVFVWPTAGAAGDHVYEGSRRARHLFDYAQANHIVIDGFEVCYGQGHGIGTWTAGSADVRIENCVVHHNDSNGISVRDTPRAVIRRNVVVHNYLGIAAGCEGGLVEENEVGWNGMDGLRVGDDNVTVRRNYLHDHVLYGHADNFQLFGGIEGMVFERNLLIHGGQQMMMEGTSDGRLVGNMFVGCEAYAVIFGHGNADDYDVLGNTIALSGYGVLNLSGKGYRLRDNVLVSGHGGPLFGFGQASQVTSDHNLLWQAPGVTGPPVVYEAGWNDTWDSYRAQSGQDAHSLHADPSFVNAPVHFQQMEGKRLLESTRERVHVRGGTGSYEVGDTIELDFDGVARTVTEVGEDFIAFAPPRDESPERAGVICNWKAATDLTLDLRLTDGSPGRTLGSDGGPVGSAIDIQAFRRGDFDGDGTRDLPLVPEDALAE